MSKKLDPKSLLDVVVNVGVICAIILFFTIVSRVMIDIIELIWSR